MCSFGAAHSHTRYTIACTYPPISSSHSAVLNGARQMRTGSKMLPLTTVVPSNATQSTAFVCPLRVCVHSPDRTFHTRTVLSRLPVTSLSMKNPMTYASFMKNKSINYEQCTINIRNTMHCRTQHSINVLLEHVHTSARRIPHARRPVVTARDHHRQLGQYTMQVMSAVCLLFCHIVRAVFGSICCKWPFVLLTSAYLSVISISGSFSCNFMLQESLQKSNLHSVIFCLFYLTLSIHKMSSRRISIGQMNFHFTFLWNFYGPSLTSFTFWGPLTCCLSSKIAKICTTH